MLLSIKPPVGGDFRSQSGSAISPDGRLIAFVAHDSRGPDRLWVRPLDSGLPRVLAGTEDATFPFWKPDSRVVGFFASGKLKRVAVDGGSPVIICDAPANRGGSWNRDDVIVFHGGNDTALQRISALGGSPERLTTLQAGENSHRWPQFLPDGRHLLFFVRAGNSAENIQKMGIYLTSLDRPSEKVLVVPSPVSGVYVPGTGRKSGPGGRRIALDRLGPAGPPSNTWVMDAQRGIAARLTFSYGLSPVWSPDGRFLALTPAEETEASRLFVLSGWQPARSTRQ